MIAGHLNPSTLESRQLGGTSNSFFRSKQGPMKVYNVFLYVTEREFVGCLEMPHMYEYISINNIKLVLGLLGEKPKNKTMRA